MATPMLSKLGTIIVEFRRIRIEPATAAFEHSSTNSLEQSVAVHEKQKKLGGHHTMYVLVARL